MNDDDEQAVSLLRQQLKSAFWDIHYHEKALRMAHKHLGVVRSFLEYTDLSVTDEKAAAIYVDGAEIEDCESPLELAQWMLGSALHSITHHEDGLKTAHAALGSWKALMLRASIDLPLAEIEQEALKNA